MKTAVSSKQVLDECLDDALQQAKSLITNVIQSVVDSLEQKAEGALTSRERQTNSDLLREVRKVSPQLVTAFMRQFTDLLNGVVPKSTVGTGDDFMELTLVEDSAMQEDVEVRQLIQQIEAKSDWEIRDLNARMSALRGKDVARVEDNPLRPELFGRSLQKAVHSVPLGGEDRLAMLRSFGGAMSSALKDTYSAYNEKLKARNIQPVGFRVRQTMSGRSGGGGGAAQQAGQGPAWQDSQVGQSANQQSNSNYGMPQTPMAPGSNAALDPYFHGALQNLMRGGAASQQGYSNQHEEFANSIFGQAVRNEQLNGMLAQMGVMPSQFMVQPGEMAAPAYHNVIAQYRDDLQQAANRPIERLTIDVVSMMFDHILGDPRLLSGIKAALGRLQIPVLRVALADAAIFSSRNHPTRKLINRIASYSSGFESESDTNYERFHRVVNTGVETIMALESEDAGIYTMQLERIEIIIAEITQEREAQAAVAVEALERAELRTVMRSSLSHHIASLVANVDIEEYLADFMREQWTQVLVEAILHYGEDSESTRYFKQVGSDLVWSVQPKTSDEDRQHLIKLLPRLVKQLREGLSLIEWPISEEQKLFARLMTSHARAIRRDADVKVMSDSTAAELRRWKDSVANAWGAQVDVDSPHALADIAVKSSEKQASGLIDESDVASTQFPSTQYPSTEFSDDEDGAPSVIAANAPIALDAAEALTGDDWAERVIKGNWYQLLLGGEWVKVQLFWKSPKGLFFMFSSNVGGKAHSLTSRALDKMRKEGAFALLEAESLVDRAVADVMNASRRANEGGAADVRPPRAA